MEVIEMPMIQVKDLTKMYKPMRMSRQDKRESKSKEGLKKAVNNISFEIEAGELVGYIGPNGAGKSTTIKMLTGILQPTSGEVKVFGKVPYENRRENATNIGVLFGQRSQLWPDLPIKDTFRLHRALYDIEKFRFLKQQAMLVDLLGLSDFFDRPVRQLSLGQRMRGELALSMLHQPKVLYLDEPTIGMDVLVKEKIREHLLELNRQEGLTVMLTSHDLSEVERTCKRVMLINNGKLLFDGKMESLRARCSADSVVNLTLDHIPSGVNDKLRELKYMEDGRIQFLINRSKGEAVLLSDLLSQTRVYDLSITEPPIEDVIRDLYGEGEDVDA